nr:nuclear pore complex protein DDB_G0274915-like [Cherax quadricarinatus]
MFSSNLSLLKLQIPKYAERKRIHRSSTQMSNKGKEKSELVSTMTELPQCQPITAEDNQPSIPSSHTSQSCITPCTLKTDRNYSTRNDYNICGQARFISEVGRRDASHPSQSAALASERGTGESNSFTREAKNELPVNTGTQQNDSMAFPTFKKGITTDGNLSSECQTPVCTTSTVVGESSLQVLDQVHMSPKRLIPEALSTAGSVTTVANTKSSESHSSHLSLCSMQTESMDMSKMDESLPSSQGFNLTDDSGIDNTQMTSTSDMVETFSYPRVSAGQLHTSSLIVEPPASRNVSAVSSPLSSNFASAPATVTSPRTEETLNKDIPASVQSSLLPGNPMFYSSPLSLTNATQLSSSSTAQNLQTSQSSESLYSLSPILQPGGSHVNIHPSSNSVSTSASSAFMLGGDSFDDGMGSGAMSLFGSPVAQTNAEVPHQGQSGVTFSLFGESSSPKPDSGGFFSFNFGSDADNNPESGSSGFLSSLFSSPTKDSNSQGGGAGFKFF